MHPALLALALLLLALPPAGAQVGEDPRVQAVVLVYHLAPDPRAGTPEADPFSAVPPPARLAAEGGALRLPATLVDGVAQPREAGGDPAAVLSRFTQLRDLVLLRQRTAADLPLDITGSLAAGELRVTATFTTDDEAAGPVDARMVLFEDPARDPRDGREHRNVVRAAAPPERVERGAGRVERVFPLDAAWDPARLGVAVVIERAGEALQAGAWRADHEGLARHARKVVLVEHVSATWCDPCRPADDALALLADQYGPRAADADARAAYAPRLTLPALAGLALGATVGVLLLRRRDA